MPIVFDSAAFREALAADTAAKLAGTAGAVEAAAHLVGDEAKRLLELKSHPRGTKTPSAPDEPPAMQVPGGKLRDSIKVTGPTPTALGGFEAEVGPTTVYGRIQELGGIAGRGARLPARPYLRPALAKAEIEILGLFIAAWGGL